MTQPQQTPMSRRRLLKAGSCGFGYLALAGLATETANAARHRGPLAARNPHFPARAKRVIFMFMQGGPSQLETFDHQPKLLDAAGKTVSPSSQKKGRPQANVLPPKAKFAPCGESGLMISELFPYLGQHADDLCLLNAVHTDSPAHPQATIMLHTGSINFVRPSLGSWTVYGLGTENENLPGFVTINPSRNVGGAQNYGSAFLPACFQGTRLGTNRDAMADIRSSHVPRRAQRQQLDLVQAMNRDLLARCGANDEVEGVIQSYELAFRMQTAVPEIVDISDESQETKDRYGIGRGPTSAFGTQCLMARRMAEADVRFIEISKGGWDQHNNLKKAIANNCLAIDQPIAALMTDLKERGMLDETLIVWGGEFGRTPVGQGADGRRHNHRGYTMWMAGGGVRGGIRYGVTDAVTGVAVENRIHTHDLHATILHLLGIDHEKLTYRYAGRDFRLTDVYGDVVRDILA